jgi:DNA-directed RNA polymerase specialized sigma24 family protein
MRPLPHDAHQRLLSQLDWVERLAAHLVRDHSSAEDLAQATLTVALTEPPRIDLGARGLRAWLAQVMRNVLRQGARSDARSARRPARCSGRTAQALT